MSEEKTNEERLAEMESNADAEKAAREAPKKAKKPKSYTNTSKVNVFSSKGRIAPGQSMALSADEAKILGLE